MLGGLSDDELAELLYRAIRDGDQVMMRAIAAQLVDRHAGIEPGRRVAGTYYLFKALRKVNLEAILGRLRQEQTDAGESPLDNRLADLDYAAPGDAFPNEVESEIRERMGAHPGPGDGART